LPEGRAAVSCAKNVLDKAWEDKPLKEVVKQSPSVLQGVTEADAQHLADAFGITTVADLANHKFVRWAQALTTLAEYE
jgi:predicted RecB family nuclease